MQWPLTVHRCPQLNAATLGKAVVVQFQDDPTALSSPADNAPSFKCICVIISLINIVSYFYLFYFKFICVLQTAVSLLYY